ncbi:enoyl-CoA hydratase-related protein [Immundisolibacter sp.]|uniref:enoyl-CoA hydratase-related protein n=1 Tax=Immundisolibacter sp. TaxID=1934948 RepID=UPI002B0BEEEE|nr:enoyl-CoA hydratase-related protein [Immundisolibacter sp.]MEA3219565.1 Crotonyl-CoA hydratase [Immundisolibacter sp.]
MYQGYQRLKFHRDGSILTIALSNPTARNAVDADMHAELARVFLEVALDTDTRVVVLTGDPDGKAFCAGGDLKWIESIEGKGERYAVVLKEGLDIVKTMSNTPQPIVSMINGHAMGLGATIGLFADVSFMDETAKIADPHVSIGVVAGDGGAIIWPLLIGPNRAKEFLMTGDALTGTQAAAIGLVNHAVPAAELQERAYAFARKLASGPQLAIQLTKRSVNLFVGQVIEQVLTASLAMEGLTFASADHREALRAFFAKEKPKFQ